MYIRTDLLKMIRLGLLFTFILGLVATSTFAQGRYDAARVFKSGSSRTKKETSVEFGPYLGAMNYIGDLTNGPLPAFNETHPTGGLTIKFNLNSDFTFKTTAIYGRISGTDVNYDNDAFRKRRNLSFRSNMLEVSGQFEYNIGGFHQTNTLFSACPYLFFGASYLKHNPKAYFTYNPSLHDPSLERFNDQWIELQPLATEGQEATKFNDRKRYNLSQISIPFGVGFKQALSEQWGWAVEFGLRKTLTDYLDDISTDYVDDQIVGGQSTVLAVALKDRAAEAGQIKFEPGELRGNSKTKDWYMVAGVTFTYRIITSVGCFHF